LWSKLNKAFIICILGEHAFNQFHKSKRTTGPYSRGLKNRHRTAMGSGLNISDSPWAFAAEATA